MWMVGNRAVQEAHSYDPGQHGLFTYQLLKGLGGAADLDKNGTILAGELCTYTKGQVLKVAQEQYGNEAGAPLPPWARPGSLGQAAACCPVQITAIAMLAGQSASVLGREGRVFLTCRLPLNRNPLRLRKNPCKLLALARGPA